MGDFLQFSAQRFADELFLREVGPISLKCHVCQSEEKLFRCRQCYTLPPMCHSCVSKQHQYSYLHVLEEWDPDRGFWRRCSLGNLGLVIDLGHSGGPCELSASERAITVVHEHGIHTLTFKFCGHLWQNGDTEVVDDAIQLLRVGLWSATRKLPKTVFTLGMLRQFTLLGAQAPIPAQDYMKYLARLTDNVVPSEVDVSEFQQ